MHKKEVEHFEYFFYGKEPRDIAIQGKPSKLVAYLIPVLLIA
jgi:hypothetical protein